MHAMSLRTIVLLAGAVLMGIISSAAIADVVVLPDTSQTTTMTATVSEQCNITVPANFSWDVIDVASDTISDAQAVTITNIVLAAPTKQLKLSIQASAASFTPPGGVGTTWSASDVSWNDGGAWTGGTGATGTLSNAAYNEVATSTAGEAAMSTVGLVFTLADKGTITKSGNHTLLCTWRVESIGA